MKNKMEKLSMLIYTEFFMPGVKKLHHLITT